MLKKLLPISLTVVGSLLLTCTDVQAGWRYTNWGMSEQEVKNASDGVAYVARGGLPAYWNELPRLLAKARFGNFEFLAEFYFDEKEKLTKVRLMPRSEIWCVDMFRLLNKHYSTYVGPSDNGYIWLDPTRNNRILLSGFGGCKLTYSSLDNSDN